MDNSLFHIIFTSALTVIVAVSGWLFKSYIQRITALETKLTTHELSDAAKHSTLETKSDEIFRRLDKMEETMNNKLDKLYDLLIGLKK